MSTSDRHRVRLNPGEPRPDFDCDDNDLNDYFQVDSIDACKELVAVTYAIYEGEKVIAYYCVSNDAIRRDITSGSKFRRIQKGIKTREKRYRSMPAVKIGRFAVRKEYQKSGIGTQLMSGIKYDFVNGNKTGCRFIIVDAYNNTRSINFYQKNGFDFLTNTDVGEKTRLMFFDLIRFVNADDNS